MFDFSLLDMTPYNRTVYFDMLGEYNRTLWPVHFFVMFFGLYLIFILIKEKKRLFKIVLPILGMAWMISGWQFFIETYSSINWAGTYFGYLFIIQGVLLILSGLIFNLSVTQSLIFKLKRVMPMVLLVCLLMYPLSGLWDGRKWQELEYFALTPEATLIFSMIFLLLINERIKYLLIIVPIIWSVISISFAITLDLSKFYWILAVLSLWLIYSVSYFYLAYKKD